jgi:hypothetical protein
MNGWGFASSETHKLKRAASDWNGANVNAENERNATKGNERDEMFPHLKSGEAEKKSNWP